MSVLALGLLFGGVTLAVMFSGMPIAFALGFVAMLFMAIFMPAASLDTVTQNVYEEMASITLLSIPLFILKGAAIGKSRTSVASALQRLQAAGKVENWPWRLVEAPHKPLEKWTEPLPVARRVHAHA